MSRTWTVSRVGLALLPAALVGLGVAGTAAAAPIPPLYFANNGGGEIGYATNLTITGTHQIPTNQNAISTLGFTTGVAVYGQQIYWANEQTSSGSGSIGVASLDANGNPVASSVNLNLVSPTVYRRPAGIAVTGQHIYWTDTYNGTIDMANRDGSDPTALITGIQDPVGIAVNAQHVYWANAGTGGNVANGSGSIGEANLDGSDPNPKLIPGLDEPTAISLTANGIYWVSTIDHEIGVANLDGSGVKTNFLPVNQPSAVAALDGSIFWADNNYDAIGAENLDGTDNNYQAITGLSDPEAMAFATPNITAAPTSLNAAPTATGATYGPMTVTVTNAGLANLDVYDATIGGADPGDFSIASNTCFNTVAFGLSGSCQIGIDYTPQEAQGSSSAALEIDSNDLVDGPQYIPLSGTVQVPTTTTTTATTPTSTTPVTPVSTTPTNTTAPYVPPPPPLPIASGGGASSGGGGVVAAFVTTPGFKSTAAVSGAGVVTLPISCSTAASCSGTVTLTTVTSRHGHRLVASHAKRSTQKVTLGSAHYTLAAGATSHVAVHLSSKGLKLLKAAKGERLKVTAVIAGGSQTLTRSLTLLAPKAKPKQHKPKH